MAYPIYSPFDYSMGATPAGATDSAQARAALNGMKRSLKGWLKFRAKMDDYVAGTRKAPALFRNPGAKPLPPAVVARTLPQERFAIEQDLAETLHSLLLESGCDAKNLPTPDVSKSPDVAAQLAAMVIESPLQGETASPEAQGIVWLLAIPIAGAVLVLSQMIKSKADLAKREAELRCIESGGCTDSGFWLKIASVSVIAWLAWDKLGLKEAAARRRK